MTYKETISKLVQKAQEMKKSFMLYGCYGYTGALIVDLIVEHKATHLVVLAGRDASKVREHAQRCHIDRYVSFSLDNSEHIAQIIKEQRVNAVLHVAGPFIKTARPMIDACLSAGVSYLDITGEISVFEYSLGNKEMNTIAEKKDICILSGVGFDVVPTDCLARKVADEYRKRYNGETPDMLDIGIAFGGTPSRGTLKTALTYFLENFGYVQVRRNGNIEHIRLFSQFKNFHFEHKRKDMKTSAVSWGDVSTAYYSTGQVPNITVSFATSQYASFIMSFYLVQLLLWLFLRFIFFFPSVGHKLIDLVLPAGPDERKHPYHPDIVAIASSKDGTKKVTGAAMTGPPYQFTAQSSLLCVLKVLVGNVEKYGCVTPSIAFGSDFINEFDPHIASQHLVNNE
jgi:short subunit dehydrogenase-like uncharacterized protein